ncbi:YdcF family protein [Pseudonocardia phyllosphaerae]|uniref:YdcF family protein n=1 Tax=Pseudonocardia phyllosphaerae TaxID=3390502 RepID=UPI00397DF973
MTWGARIVVGGLVVLLLVVGVTAARVWQVARTDDRSHTDAVVVLGAAQYNGQPSAVLAARLKHAEQLWRDGVSPRIVTVGGGKSGDRYTEAEASRDWLIEQGVPRSAVEAVPQGADTLGSLQAVAATAREQGWESALLVSDPWHSLRARTMARDAGLDASTSPTRTGPVVQTREAQLHYIYRETGGLLFYELTHASVDTATNELG